MESPPCGRKPADQLPVSTLQNEKLQPTDGTAGGRGQGVRTMRRIDRCRSLAMTGLLSLMAGSLGAQVFPSGLDPIGSSRSGFHLYDVTSFAAWQSTASPSQGFFLPFAANLGSDALFGVGTSVGWTHPGAQSDIAITYTGKYTGRVVYSDWSTFNQALTIHNSRRLSQRWAIGLSLASPVTNADQLLSTPTVFDNL